MCTHKDTDADLFVVFSLTDYGYFGDYTTLGQARRVMRLYNKKSGWKSLFRCSIPTQYGRREVDYGRPMHDTNAVGYGPFAVATSTNYQLMRNAHFAEAT
jgi:hypothetical protein